MNAVATPGPLPVSARCWTNQVTLAKPGARAALIKLHQLRTHRFPEPPVLVPALDFLALAAPDPNDLGSSSAHRS